MCADSNDIFPSLWKLTNEGTIISVQDIDQDLSNGIYTSLKIYDGKRVYKFHNHFERLVQSGLLSGFSFTYSEQLMRDSIRVIINQFQTEILRVQILIFPATSGVAVYFKFGLLPSNPAGGVNTVTKKLWRNNPKAKRTDFIKLSTQEKNILPDGINEVLMVDNIGIILEGMSSNFFGYSKNTLWTAEQGVLSGTTRDSILGIIKDLNLKITFIGFPISQLDDLEEAFITSVSRGVLPVVKIDDHWIGNGKPGDTTLRIKAKYDEKIKLELENL